MTSQATLRFAILLVFAAVCGYNGEPATGQDGAPLERTLVGRLLLPTGSGSRGVEVQVVTVPSGGESRTTWVLFDEQGRFSHTFHETLASINVTVGIGREIHRIDAEALPDVNQTGQIDVGTIDLRDRLMSHRLMLRAAVGKPPGDVRVAMSFGLPPVGPGGEPVSLGSRQFPPAALGSELEWLIPHGARDVYFLVERPASPNHESQWRSGQQHLFGPFTSSELPVELILDN